MLDAPWLYSLDDFFGSLAHGSNVSRYTIGVNTSCLYYTNSVALAAVNTRWSDFITGFLIGVLVDLVIQVIVDLLFYTHTL
jgi:hypothetical protein